MSILIACISDCDPIVTWEAGSWGPLFSVLEKKYFTKLICLYPSENLKRREILNDHLTHHYPELSVSHELITHIEPITSISAAMALQSKLTDLYLEETEYDFLPNTHDPIWHTAALILWFQGILPSLLDPIAIPYRPGINLSEMKDLMPPSTAMNVAMGQEIFGDDLAVKMGLIGNHPNFNQAIYQANVFGKSSLPIFLLGPSGTGKGLFARYIHAVSDRSSGPFIALNCAALPENLAESILFGHEKGAFTGAIKDFKGKFRQAHGGTLFLDEIGELPLFIQAKLLRAIEEFEIESIGAESSEIVDIRIIAATNKNIASAIRDHTFREDLYFRLRVGELILPSLSERSTDIPCLAIHLLEKFNQIYKTSKRLSPETLSFLEKQNWPGNIRDLNNVIMRAALLTISQVLRPDDFNPQLSFNNPKIEKNIPDLYPGFLIEDYLSQMRSLLIKKALDQALGNQSHAARLLGITPQAVSKFCAQAKDVMRKP